MNQNNLFPIFLKLKELNTLIVGGGYTGFEKLSNLLKNSAEARITLIARSISNEIKILAKHYGNVILTERDFDMNDLIGKHIVILATNDQDLHKSILEVTRSKHVLVNVADKPDQCDFYLGSVVSKGNLKIGISTNGKSPTIAKRLREYFEEVIPENINVLLITMSAARKKIKGDFSYRVKLLNEITSSWIKDYKE